MSDEELLAEWMIAWEACRDRGESFDPGQHVPADRADLLSELERQIQCRLGLLKALDLNQRSGPESFTNTQASSENAQRQSAGERHGRFVIQAFHKHGGMGEVLIAEDQELGRKVALKRIQARFRGDASSRQRFLREAAITGRLEHPGIVPIYGLVHGEDGQPVYAMRFIQGQSLADAINQFHGDAALQADESQRNLALRRLLQKFTAICNTVAYAHSQGVVHRDIKPANLMLGQYGETLVVDWGLAKVMTSRPDRGSHEAGGAESSADIPPKQSLLEAARSAPSTAGSDMTAQGAVMGTAAYMSPEQAAGDWDHVGPASDIYSLGATLYILLTGTGPVRAAGGQATLAFPSPRTASRSVPPALKAICRKALALTPADRYATATDLAQDIDRWLADEPVAAHHEPWTVRAERWVRKHRTLATSIAVLLLTAAVTGGVATVLVAREQANTAHAKLEAQLKDQEARYQNDLARQITGFLTALFESADPTALQGSGFRANHERVASLTAIHLLDKGTEQVRSQLEDQPLLKASMMNTLGNTYRGLGEQKRAEPLLAEALALRRVHLPSDHVDIASSLHNLGWLNQDRGNFREAERYYRDALSMRRRLLGVDHLDVSHTLFNLAWVLSMRVDGVTKTPDRGQEAEQCIREAIAIRRKRLGEKHQDIGMAILLQAAIQLGRGAQELELLTLISEAGYHLGPDSSDKFLVKGLTAWNAAESARRARNYAEAESQHRELNQIARGFLGDQHPMYAMLLGNYAGLLREKGDLVEAEKVIREVFAIGRRYAFTHPAMVQAMAEAADHLAAQRRWAEAEELYREALERGGNCYKPNDPFMETVTKNLANVLRTQGKNAEADALGK